jgi:hypothetical protein
MNRKLGNSLNGTLPTLADTFKWQKFPAVALLCYFLNVLEGGGVGKYNALFSHGRT